MPILAIIATLATAPSAAAPPPQQMMCTEPMPAGMESWIDPIFLKSGTTLPLGKAARVTLVPAATFAVAPEKPAAAGTNGGVFTFRVATAGRYRVSLGAPVWIDVVRGAKRIAAVAHGHGGECSPIKKKVDFALVPGNYTLQLSGAKAAVIGVFVGPAR